MDVRMACLLQVLCVTLSTTQSAAAAAAASSLFNPSTAVLLNLFTIYFRGRMVQLVSCVCCACV